MSKSVRPQRWQPTRLPGPWDSPGKNTGVGCHFLLQCMKVKRESEVAQSCLTLSDPMDCSLPGSSVHGIFQARVLYLIQHYFDSSLPCHENHHNWFFWLFCLFRSMIHFELIFAYGTRYDQFLLLIWGAFCTEVFKFSNSICCSAPRGMWDLSSLTRDWTHAPLNGRQGLDHWTARKSHSSDVYYWINWILS